MPDLSSVFIVYGPLGLMALVSILAAGKLYRDSRAERDKYDLALKVERDKCEAERQVYLKIIQGLEDRVTTKAETFMDKYAELTKSTNQVLDSLVKARRT